MLLERGVIRFNSQLFLGCGNQCFQGCLLPGRYGKRDRDIRIGVGGNYRAICAACLQSVNSGDLQNIISRAVGQLGFQQRCDLPAAPAAQGVGNSQLALFKCGEITGREGYAIIGI